MKTKSLSLHRCDCKQKQNNKYKMNFMGSIFEEQIFDAFVAIVGQFN